jgi:3-dehydroquinate dehydratase/shikimate dehydrogenase
LIQAAQFLLAAASVRGYSTVIAPSPPARLIDQSRSRKPTIMICISIAQESRRFALVDMLNAARQCDLLEVRLDRFGKAPEVGELLAAKPKPVIMSCRRPQDGGQWDGTEDERLAILRQCIISKADYVEIELDAADQIRPFPPSKRVISYTNLDSTPGDLAEIYAKAQTKKPDVIKLVTHAATPEEAWPLVQILGKPAVPTVVVGLGKPGVMLTVLGKKMGAPWTYAALERGMEAYPEQPTVHDLEAVYHYRAIDRHTKLVGVTGFTEQSYVTVAAVNAALVHLGVAGLCLPMEVGNVRLFRKVMEAVKLSAAIIDDEHRVAIRDLAKEREAGAERAGAADLLVHHHENWHGYYTLDRAAAAALEGTLRTKKPGDKPLEGRTVMLIGVTGTARAMAYRVHKRGGIPIIASRDKNAAHQLAQEIGCRYIAFDAIYSTLHDVLIACAEEQRHATLKGKPSETGVHAGYLKPTMTVMDLTSGPRRSTLLREAADRGCGVVSPRRVLLEHVLQQVKLIAGKETPAEPVAAAINAVLGDEEE